MDNQHSSIGGPTGCGLLGCAGGLLLGLFGGGLLLALLSFGWALASSVPSPPIPTNATPDLRLTLHETFLNRMVQDSMGETARLDVLPDNRLSLETEVEVTGFGLSVTAQVTGMFEVRLVEQSLVVSLVDVQVSGLDLPPEMTGLFEDNLPALNQDLNQALDQLSTELGTPITLTGLGTDDNRLWVEAREAR